MLTKEKIDRQLAEQSSSVPFMNIKDGYISKKVTFNTQDSLEEKIDKFMSMMSKLTPQDDDKIRNLILKYIKAKGEDTQDIFMIEIIKIDIGQIVEIGEYHSVVEYDMDRITETNQGIIRTIRVILEEEILEGIYSQIRITEIKFVEMDTGKSIERIIMKEVKVGLGIDSILIKPEGMIEVIVGLDHIQELVPI